MAECLRNIVLAGSLLAISLGFANAEEGRKLPRLGEVFAANPSVYKPYDDALRDGLRSLGYVDGKNVILLPRYAYGDPTQFPGLLRDLVAGDVDVLVVSIAAVRVAMQATRTIPIVAPAMAEQQRLALRASSRRASDLAR